MRVANHLHGELSWQATFQPTEEPREHHEKVHEEQQRERQEVRGFTAEERAAMKERVQELKAETRRGKADGEIAVLAKIGEMPEPDRAWPRGSTRSSRRARQTSRRKPGTECPRMQRTARSSASSNADKFNARYATLGFNDAANLDEGAMWPTSFALKELTDAEETRIGALVKKAVSSSLDLQSPLHSSSW